MVSLNLEPQFYWLWTLYNAGYPVWCTNNTGFQNPLRNNTGKPVLSIDTQYWKTSIFDSQYWNSSICIVEYWIPVLFYSTILENTGQYWNILNFQYCEITSIAQYCTQKNTGFPVLSKGSGKTQYWFSSIVPTILVQKSVPVSVTILAYQYCDRQVYMILNEGWYIDDMTLTRKFMKDGVVRGNLSYEIK